MEQVIRRPDWDRGTASEVASYLRITERAFDELVQDGTFPPGDRINAKNHTWTWQEAVATNWLMTHLLRIRERLKSQKNVSPKMAENEDD
jgi:predicted DNA-binding transcriptional regulator AlpA